MSETKVEICSDCGQPKPIKLELYPGRLLCDVCSTRWLLSDEEWPRRRKAPMLTTPRTA